jgi:hypothetical protein
VTLAGTDQTREWTRNRNWRSIWPLEWDNGDQPYGCLHTNGTPELVIEDVVVDDDDDGFYLRGRRLLSMCVYGACRHGSHNN